MIPIAGASGNAYNISGIFDPLIFRAAGWFANSGEMQFVANHPVQEEFIHCEYCKRRAARGKEICSGCGAPLP